MPWRGNVAQQVGDAAVSDAGCAGFGLLQGSRPITQAGLCRFDAEQLPLEGDT